MALRRTALMAGLALATASGTAIAAPITYDVNFSITNSPNSPAAFPLSGAAVLTGSLTTDGTTGPLALSNIKSQDLTLFGGGISHAVAITGILGNSFLASQSALSFAFDDQGSILSIADPTISYTEGFFTGPFISFGGKSFVNATVPGGLFGQSAYQSETIGSTVVIGTVEGAGVSPVPLPASAAMFGGALLSLAGLSYVTKRRPTTAAAT